MSMWIVGIIVLLVKLAVVLVVLLLLASVLTRSASVEPRRGPEPVTRPGASASNLRTKTVDPGQIEAFRQYVRTRRAVLNRGVEAIPASSATSEEESTHISGMVLDDDFYTNLFALAGANGVTMDVDLLDPDGVLLDTVEIVLEAYEPWLSGVATLWDVSSFANGTARATVTDGSMVMLGSKVDRASKDPTTLELEFGAGAGSVDGIYQFTIWDEGFAAGGELLVADGLVVEIYGTYANYQKLDDQNDPACAVTWQWGFDFPTTGVPVESFASGYAFTEDFRYYEDGGEFTWTLTFTFDDNVGFSGTIDAVAAEFSGADAGCNGTYPQLPMLGGKAN